jgi:2-amino-1-hydroxyethylphosphonate dioxygenase (glycine-forming)
MKDKVDQIIDEVFDLYELHGGEDYIGEPVSQLEHMSQSAQLAVEQGYDDEVVLAAFFHDIGHICVMQNASNSMDGYGVKRHEKVGADYLRSKGFPERIAKLVESHVQAKRFLTYKYPEYYNSLSDASKKTLEFQGGRMEKDEADVFEADSLFETSILMRKWDELAKEINVPIIDMNDLKDRARNVLTRSLRNTLGNKAIRL